MSTPPAHRERLEGELLAAYDARRWTAPARRGWAWRRWAFAACALFAVWPISQVPASYTVEVGTQVEMELPSGADPSATADALIAALAPLREPTGQVGELRARISQREPGGTQLSLEVWSVGLSDAALEARVHAVPGLAGVPVRLTRLAGKVTDTLAGLAKHLLRRGATPEERERARRAVVEALQQQEGADAHIQVEVSPDGRRLQVNVRKPAEGP